MYINVRDPTIIHTHVRINTRTKEYKGKTIDNTVTQPPDILVKGKHLVLINPTENKNPPNKYHNLILA